MIVQHSLWPKIFINNNFQFQLINQAYYNIWNYSLYCILYSVYCLSVRFRITLHLEVTKGLFSINNNNLPEMSTFAPYKEAGVGCFFSTADALHYWSNSSRNHSLLLEGSEVITSLYYLNPNKVIVSRKNAVSLYVFDNETLNLVNHLVCDQQIGRASCRERV